MMWLLRIGAARRARDQASSRTTAPADQDAAELVTRLQAAHDVKSVVDIATSPAYQALVPGSVVDRTLREFAADCLDAIDRTGHYRDCSELARRAARGEVRGKKLYEARGSRSGVAGALGAFNNYHIASAALAFASLAVLSDTAAEAAVMTAWKVSLYHGFALLHSLEGNPLPVGKGWNGREMWGPWSEFRRAHHEEEQHEIDRAARELANDLRTRLCLLLQDRGNAITG